MADCQCLEDKSWEWAFTAFHVSHHKPQKTKLPCLISFSFLVVSPADLMPFSTYFFDFCMCLVPSWPSRVPSRLPAPVLCSASCIFQPAQLTSFLLFEWFFRIHLKFVRIGVTTCYGVTVFCRTVSSPSSSTPRFSTNSIIFSIWATILLIRRPFRSIWYCGLCVWC